MIIHPDRDSPDGLKDVTKWCPGEMVPKRVDDYLVVKKLNRVIRVPKGD